MSELLNAFKTTADNVFKKKEDSIGRTYYVREGEGRISREKWAGANRSLEHVITDVDGEFPREIREAFGSAEDLERVTEIPFTRNTFRSVAGEATTKEDRLRAESNRFLSFWSRNDHLTRAEAAKEYLEFRNELRDVSDPEARAVIKQRYNIGGS